MDDTQLKLADAQLLGFHVAVTGGTIIDLIEGMGLTAEEWETLKTDSITLLNMRQTDIEDIEAFFSREDY